MGVFFFLSLSFASSWPMGHGIENIDMDLFMIKESAQWAKMFVAENEMCICYIATCNAHEIMCITHDKNICYFLIISSKLVTKIHARPLNGILFFSFAAVGLRAMA